jgi:hypothetical protein
MNYTVIRKQIQEELDYQEEQGQIQQFKDILRKEDIDLYY